MSNTKDQVQADSKDQVLADINNTTTNNNTLGVLEEDDEFEEFTIADWDDSQTDLAHLGGVAPGAAKSAGDKLWEDNWDDDDIEDDFSVQLRGELEKIKQIKEASGET